MQDPASEAARPQTIGAALRQAQDWGVARLDAQWLLVDLLTSDPAQAPRPDGPITRGWLLAHDDWPLGADLGQRWRLAVQRRAAGEPLAYVLGHQDFCGLRLTVNQAVLIPRPETEDLVNWALSCLQQCHRDQPRVMDMGTGSGAIALAIKHRWPQAQVCASDLSLAALEVARGNALRHELQVNFMHADWWTPLGVTEPASRLGRFEPYDLVVSNPPYIAEGDVHLDALRHEPRSALVAPGQGLKDLQVVIAGSLARISSGGWLLLEHGHDQGAAVQQWLVEAGFEAIETRPDLAGLPRCTAGRRPPRAGVS